MDSDRISSLVAIGLVGEWSDDDDWKKTTLYKFAKLAVIFGVVGELARDAGVFRAGGRAKVIDEGKISSQQEKIIALEDRLAARSLSDDQIVEIVQKLRFFNGQSFDIITYWQNAESYSIMLRIYEALTKAGWVYDKPTNAELMLGVQTGISIWSEKRLPAASEAGAALIKVLTAAGLLAAEDPQQRGSSSLPPIKDIINVGIKPKRTTQSMCSLGKILRRF